ncbi:hypothetical protein [Psychroserpens luteolus]|uniref:hypothetical protein n=1 Tax=Psychroserpens luteolus TaxID=2855840 RepID=UPI001E35E8E0|nr:hypothetical protein [Psychroserpens luteolus]MCD2257688.1 hypothetical protein [Psychroserpens luteolus]
MDFFLTNILGPWSWNRFESISFGGVLAMLGIILFFLIIDRIFNKKPSRLILENDADFEHYTLGLENYHNSTKRLSLVNRLVMYSIVLLLVLTPLNFLLKLTDSYFVSFWSWMF